MTLRVEMIADAAGVTRPYLVDVEHNEILPCQAAGSLEWTPDGVQFSVTFVVDHRNVTIAPTNPESTDAT